MDETKKLKAIIWVLLFLFITSLGINGVLLKQGRFDAKAKNNKKLSKEVAQVNQEKEEVVIKELTQDEVKLAQKDAEDFCLKKELNDQEKAICLSGNDAYFATRAVKDLKEGYCLLVRSTSERSGCLNNVFLNKALVEKNEAYCEKLSEKPQITSCKNEIFYYQASSNQTEAKKYCDKITSNSLKQACVDKFVERK